MENSAAPPPVNWQEHGQQHSAPWRTSSGLKPPRTLRIVDDRLRADEAMALASEGTGMLWRGDFRNARQLLNALKHRLDKRTAKPAPDPAAAFYRHRQARGHRARILSLVVIELDADFGIDLAHAPDVRRACREALGDASGSSLVSLQELLGVIGAHQWRHRGIEVPALGARIHPHFGVFAPTRNEYVDLVAQAPLPATGTAFDLGTGTGVLAAVLARRGITRVLATDVEARAVACARANIERLGLAGRIEVVLADVFPPGRADLVVCNPPWVPAAAPSSLERGVFDAGGRMLGTFINELAAHLAPGGEGWLVLSDLAERLGLRSRDQLTEMFRAAELVVLERLETVPRHPRAANRAVGGGDPMAAASAAEVVSLWRLAAADSGQLTADS